jgi:hypothetical protein
MDNIKTKAILLFESAKNFTTDLLSRDEELNSTEWSVTYVPNLEKIYNEIAVVIKQLKDAENYHKDPRFKDLIKIGEELRKRLFRLKSIHSTVKEQSSTNIGGATQSNGDGIGYTSKNAFIPYKKIGYKKVPKSKHITVKKLFNEEQTPNLKNFQRERIDAFDDIALRVNQLLPLVSNAKNDTVEYYNQNPQSFDIYLSSEIILNYLKKIENLLKPNK